MLGQIPEDSPKIHPEQPGLGTTFPWSSGQCWVQRSWALPPCQQTAPNQVGLKPLHCSQPGQCMGTHAAQHRICLNTHVRLRRFRCLNTYKALSDQPDTHLSHSGIFYGTALRHLLNWCHVKDLRDLAEAPHSSNQMFGLCWAGMSSHPLGDHAVPEHAAGSPPGQQSTKSTCGIKKVSSSFSGLAIVLKITQLRVCQTQHGPV